LTCPICNCPLTVSEIREADFENVLVDREYFECGHCWSEVLTLADFEAEVIATFIGAGCHRREAERERRRTFTLDSEESTHCS
jgi:hypothetical protein